MFGDDYHLDTEIVMYFDEICTNIPSIYMMLDRFREAKDSMEKTVNLCQNKAEFQMTLGKLKLMQASILLKKRRLVDAGHLNNIDKIKCILHGAQSLMIDCSNPLKAEEGLLEIKYLHAIINI